MVVQLLIWYQSIFNLLIRPLYRYFFQFLHFIKVLFGCLTFLENFRTKREQTDSKKIADFEALTKIKDLVSSAQTWFYLIQVNILLFCIASLFLVLFKKVCITASKNYIIFTYLMGFLYLPNFNRPLLWFMLQISLII